MSSPTPAAPYQGNPSLPAEVREKILATFRHALTLFSSGNVNDCLIGCEFILKMDPRFTPARRLQEKVRNHDSDVDISELQAAANAGGAPGPSPSAAAPSPTAPPAAPRVEKPDPRRLLADAAKKFEAGDFDATIAAATSLLTLQPGNKDALALIERAGARKATRPLIESSLARAEQALDDGQVSEARLEVERMRAMDPEHPAIAPLERRLSDAAPSPPGAPAPMPDFSLDSQDLDPFDPGLQDEGLESHDDFAGFSRVSSEPPGLDPQSGRASGLAPRPAAPGVDGPQAEDLYPPGGPIEETEGPPPSASDLFLSVEAPSPAIPNLPGGPPPENEEEETRASKREIASLLKQGDETALKGERQQAIEIWSRVFLIDINNSEAVTRIEKARQEMAEQGRQVADSVKKGRESFEAGDRKAARAFFLQVQSLDPNDATARLYLERIEQGDSEPSRPAASPERARKSAASARTDYDLLETPPPSAAPPTAARGAGLRINARVLAVIGAFLAMTLVGVYFFVFKGSKTPEPPPRVVPAGSLQHARDLLGKGEIGEARAELRRIGPGDADSEEAHRLLADLGKTAGPDALAGKGAPAGPSAGGPPRENHTDNDPAHLRGAAEKALEEKRYIEALKNFNLAAPAYRNDPDFTKKQGLASDKVTALTPAVKFYNEGEYETAIPILWRIVQEDRGNQDASSYLLRSYYNQGITQLQNGLYPKAAQTFQEALALDPNDAESVRHKKFAERYQKGDLDLMGRIYVRHLNYRP